MSRIPISDDPVVQAKLAAAANDAAMRVVAAAYAAVDAVGNDAKWTPAWNALAAAVEACIVTDGAQYIDGGIG